MNLECGHFQEDNREFSIKTSNTPKPWVNFLWNSNFLSTFSQNGQGKSFCRGFNRSRIHLITNRMVWIIGEQKVLWSINGLPVTETYNMYECIHGQGYSSIKTFKNNIQSEWSVFVPENDNCEIWTISLKNRSENNVRLKVVSSFETGIGKMQDHTSTAAWFDKKLNALCGEAVLRTGKWYHHFTTGEKEQGFFTSDREITTYDCRTNAVYGPYGSILSPDGLHANYGCTNSNCESEDILFAIENSIELEQEEEISINLIAGVHGKDKDIIEIQKKYFQSDIIALERKRVRDSVKNRNTGISIKTDETDLDIFFNSWLKHQLHLNSMWARVYYNGFRDLCQDTANLALLQNVTAEKKLLEVLEHQYKSGFAPRAWIDDEIIEQDYSDSPVWIAYAVYSIVMEQGRTDFLSVSVPFLDDDEGSVYEHLKLSLEYLWNDRGIHGLSLIHSGDWNDMLNGAGPAGKGESVWLSMAFLKSQKLFIELAGLIGKDKDILEISNRIQKLESSISFSGWDQEWYLRGYTDSGKMIGSRENEEGSIFLNPQSWAVLSGTGTVERQHRAMMSAETHLDTDIGIRTMYPSYTRFQPELGYISSVRPGSNVNGGIYVHACIFYIKANCALKNNKKAWDAINKILPFFTARISITGSPFSIPNSYWGPAGGYKYREYGGGWTTGSAGWLFSVLVNDVFGLKSTWKGIFLEPCLPPHWENCSINRIFRNVEYNITYSQMEDGPCNKIKQIVVNGEPFYGTVMPVWDGETFNIQVTLGLE